MESEDVAWLKLLVAEWILIRETRYYHEGLADSCQIGRDTDGGGDSGIHLLCMQIRCPAQQGESHSTEQSDKSFGSVQC
jgi:hypothetical protein